jgi:hypothetical protein
LRSSYPGSPISILREVIRWVRDMLSLWPWMGARGYSLEGVHCAKFGACSCMNLRFVGQHKITPKNDTDSFNADVFPRPKTPRFPLDVLHPCAATLLNHTCILSPRKCTPTHLPALPLDYRPTLSPPSSSMGGSCLCWNANLTSLLTNSSLYCFLRLCAFFIPYLYRYQSTQIHSSFSLQLFTGPLVAKVPHYAVVVEYHASVGRVSTEANPPCNAPPMPSNRPVQASCFSPSSSSSQGCFVT